MSWNSIILIVSILAAVFLVWKEVRRVNKIHLLWRIVVSLVVAIALAFIILPVHYPGEIVLTGNSDAVLLTTGFNKDSLSVFKNERIYTIDKAITKLYPKARLINIADLQTDTPVTARLHILGYGLNEDELNQLNNLPVVFHPANVPGGITHVSWNTQLKEGKQLRIQGSYKNDRNGPVTLVLKGLNTGLDTVAVPAKAGTNFELNTTPKHTGRAVYNLLVIAGNDTLAKEDIPVEIQPVKALKILVLTASPDFETRFLKNWLTENGYGFTIRSAISKNKFVKEYVNMESLPSDRLSANVLDKFDVVMGDLSVLKTLNRDEAAVLKEQVSKKGLGVIIRADSSSKAISWLQQSFPLDQVLAKDQVVSAFNILGRKGLSSKLKIDPNYIRFENGTQPLVTNDKEHIVVNSTQYGAGRLIFDALNNTFNWTLGGNKNDYAAFWSLLISKAAQKKAVTEQWSVNSAIPVVNAPVNMQLETATQASAINIDQSQIAPIQNPAIPFQWGNTYWPVTNDWQQAKQNNGTAAWWYAYKSGSWQSVKELNALTATNQYVLKRKLSGFVTKPIHKTVQIAVPKIYFYILLLLSLTYLWVENKLAPPNPPQGERAFNKR